MHSNRQQHAQKTSQEGDVILIQPNLTWLLGTDEMYFNSSSRDGRRKSQRQGTRDESRVAECGLLSQILMIDRLKLDFFYLVMRPQLWITQRPNPRRDNMVWSSLIQKSEKTDLIK